MYQVYISLNYCVLLLLFHCVFSCLLPLVATVFPMMSFILGEIDEVLILEDVSK